jgi:hypothetical protein
MEKKEDAEWGGGEGAERREGNTKCRKEVQ